MSDPIPAPEQRITHYHDLKAYKVGRIADLVAPCGAQSKTIKVTPFRASVTCPACLDALATMPQPDDQALVIQGAGPGQVSTAPGAIHAPPTVAAVPTTPGPAILQDGAPITILSTTNTPPTE